MPASMGVASLATSWALGGCPRCGNSVLTYYGEPSCLACGWAGPTSRGTLPRKPRDGRPPT